jgi:hypothetical protein
VNLKRIVVPLETVQRENPSSPNGKHFSPTFFFPRMIERISEDFPREMNEYLMHLFFPESSKGMKGFAFSC